MSDCFEQTSEQEWDEYLPNMEILDKTSWLPQFRAVARFRPSIHGESWPYLGAMGEEIKAQSGERIERSFSPFF